MNKVQLEIRLLMCVHRNLCNGTVTTEDEKTTVLKLETHNHEGDTDFINAEKDKYIYTMKDTRTQQQKIMIYHLEFMHEM